ncbi:hypothetical protein vseg_001801 [Gypsophila vaccaria]
MTHPFIVAAPNPLATAVVCDALDSCSFAVSPRYNSCNATVPTQIITPPPRRCHRCLFRQLPLSAHRLFSSYFFFRVWFVQSI